MDRRDSIRSLFLGSMIGGLALESCVSTTPESLHEKVWQYQYGRTSEEKGHDEKLLREQYFENTEMNTIKRLANLILPPSSEGTIEQAKVPEFVEFMVKDFPEFQLPIRGGLMWLDNYCNRTFQKVFMHCSEEEQKSILDRIAYPKPDASEQSQEVQFFSLLRNLVLTGYFTSEVGIKELGYVGNQPNVWDGVPEEVLRKHKLSYPKAWEPHFLDPSTRNEVAAWDDEGNLLS